MKSAEVDVLIPTRNRPAALAATLTTLCYQTYTKFNVVIANQGNRPLLTYPVVEAVCRFLILHGHRVRILANRPPRGMAQQRQFLLNHASAHYILYLDDDVLLEPYVLKNLVAAMNEENCGFVGAAVIGLSHLRDVRSNEQSITFWHGPVTPETVKPDSPEWYRYQLHNAANLYHVQQRLGVIPDEPRKYKVAWVPACVLYDVEKLRFSGSFSFWKELPPQHSGEDVLAQLRVMKKYGGCGLIPSGAYHQELPTKIKDRKVDAPKCLSI